MDSSSTNTRLICRFAKLLKSAHILSVTRGYFFKLQNTGLKLLSSKISLARRYCLKDEVLYYHFGDVMIPQCFNQMFDIHNMNDASIAPLGPSAEFDVLTESMVAQDKVTDGNCRVEKRPSHVNELLNTDQRRPSP